jgi:hypothetical protein
MSFVSLGQMLASPNVSAAASGTFNFDRLLGLTTYTLNPSAAVTGGFSQYTITNLNTEKLMNKLRQPIPFKLIKYFEDLKWPEELTDILFIASINVRLEVRDQIERRARAMCDAPSDSRTTQICDSLGRLKAEYEAARCHPYERRPFIYNSARDICSMAQFQGFIRMSRLLYIHPLESKLYTCKPHTTLGILYYLGELIAAQNYSAKPYEPTVLVGTSEGLRTVPLFVVRRGVAVPGEAAVHVYHRGEPFFIPRPELGTVDEARSMQVLDFVSQVISAQTTSDDIPKINTIGLVAAR